MRLQLADDEARRWTIENEAFLGLYLEPIRAENEVAAYFTLAQMMRWNLGIPDLTPAVSCPTRNDLLGHGLMEVNEP